MTEYPLRLQNGHLMIRVGPEWFLIDTGCSQSFSERGTLWIDGMHFSLPTSIPHVSLEAMRDFTMEPGLSGLIGNVIMLNFDHLWDTRKGIATLAQCAAEVLAPPTDGDTIELAFTISGTPIIPVGIGTRRIAMLFDTGAKLSYLNDADRAGFPHAGIRSDFYPTIGEFMTPTSLVSASIGKISLQLQCGSLSNALPGFSQDIIGNAILKDRVTLYSPTFNEIIIGR